MKSYSLLSILVAIIVSSACREEVKQETPSVFGFESGEPFVFTEADPDFYIPVVLDKGQFSYTAADLAMNHVTSSTMENEDYFIDKRVMIYGGETKDYILTQVYNDAVADGNDTIDVTFTNLDGNALIDGDETRKTARVIILDDDNYPTSQLRIHAYWTGQKEISHDFRKDFDIDLYLMSNVTETEGGIDGNYYLTSEAVGTFEDITLSSVAPDRDYYIVLSYIGNNFNDAPAQVKAYFKLSGFGFDDTNGGNVWTCTFDEPGWYYYFGPFRKVGKTFVLQE